VEALDEAAAIIEREEQKFEGTILPDGPGNILYIISIFLNVIFHINNQFSILRRNLSLIKQQRIYTMNPTSLLTV
jgi:hypothetical protein